MTTETDILGPHAGHLHLLKRRASPSQNNPSEFAVVLLYKEGETETRHEIARIDNKHDGRRVDTHIHRLWLDTPDREYRKGWGMWRSYDWFFERVQGVERWRLLSNEYQKNHLG
jgi:hypothetical protein